ncbi:MAG TPA: cyclase family protein [Chloroflexota bacterium]|nr:cyclase family protein [Chloroflexota bacterium]
MTTSFPLVGATIVDLTLTFSPAITPVPGHPCAEIIPLHEHATHGRSNSIVRFSIHTGTHIDAPYHFFPDGATIDRVPLDQLVRPAVLCDLRPYAAPRRAFTQADLEAGGLAPGTLAGRIPVLFSGWSAAHSCAPDFYTANPYLDPAAARWLVAEGIAALGLDFAVDPAEPYPCHQVLLGAGIPLIENLIGLDQLERREFTLVALPMKIGGGNGGPARVAALYT